MTTDSQMTTGRLRVALTGVLAGFDDMVAGLEAEDSGIEVAGCGTTIDEIATILADPSLSAVVHTTSWDADGQDAALADLTADVAEIRRRTNAPVLLFSTRPGRALVEAAIAAGVDDVLVSPQKPESVVFAIRKAIAMGRPSGVVEDSRGNVITVFSPKGGTGKTVISTNLSTYLAARTSKRVLLVDLDLQFGDAAIMLGVEAERTMHELVLDPGDLDAGKLQAYVTRHRSGLDVLAAPMLPEQAEDVGEDRVLGLIEIARQAYDIVVVDTSPFFYGPMLALLQPTDRLLLLCGPDVPTLKNVRLSLRTLELLGFPPSRTDVVLNRVTTNEGLSRQDIEQALGRRVSFELPNDPSVPEAVNRGNPASLRANGTDFEQAIARLARSVAPELAQDEPELPVKSTGAVSLRRLMPRRALEGRV
jgi:pilus assembly protein CpaE